ncbi:crotonase [Desulfosarcina ovata subsp. sediminis]|uniref:Crotonase n=1 Tax=Desulfosarcina ovata subsp. sediminis TaxID=885957 RepID=A0A5K7ZFT6_9BACT|nr:enoyl-CoA hydratase-related protein [Desulfosarcina ovata]BBO81028.1 crotonase [Desulfosarcina ovata subsp. sediminis]
MQNPTTQVEICGAIGKLTFNRPEVLNAYNLSISETLTAGLETLIGADEVRVIVISGAGSAFMAGADINMLNDWNQSGDMERIRSSLETTFNPTMLEDCPKPTIAAVNGLAFGMGCEVAMGCDYRIASQDARFALPEIKLGIIPGGGGSQRLMRLVGATKALEMISTGDPIDAAEALRIGLVNQVAASDELENAIEAFASRLTGKSALALKVAKQLVHQGGNRSLYQGIEYERDCFCEILLSEDAAEGTRAFIEKRKPVFKGK